MHRILVEQLYSTSGGSLKIPTASDLETFDTDMRDEIKAFVDRFYADKRVYCAFEGMQFSPGLQTYLGRWVGGEMAEQSFAVPVFPIKDFNNPQGFDDAVNCLAALKAAFSCYFSFVNTAFASLTASQVSSKPGLLLDPLVKNFVDLIKTKTAEIIRQLRGHSDAILENVSRFEADPILRTHHHSFNKCEHSSAGGCGCCHSHADIPAEEMSTYTEVAAKAFTQTIKFHYNRCFSKVQLINRMQKELINFELFRIEGSSQFRRLIKRTRGAGHRRPTEPKLTDLPSEPEYQSAVATARKQISESNDLATTENGPTETLRSRVVQLTKQLKLLADHNVAQRRALRRLMYYENTLLSSDEVSKWLDHFTIVDDMSERWKIPRKRPQKARVCQVVSLRSPQMPLLGPFTEKELTHEEMGEFFQALTLLPNALQMMDRVQQKVVQQQQVTSGNQTRVPAISSGATAVESRSTTPTVGDSGGDAQEQVAARGNMEVAKGKSVPEAVVVPDDLKCVPASLVSQKLCKTVRGCYARGNQWERERQHRNTQRLLQARLAEMKLQSQAITEEVEALKLLNREAEVRNTELQTKLAASERERLIHAREVSTLREECEKKVAEAKAELKRSETSRKSLVQDMASMRTTLARMKEEDKSLKAEFLELQQQLAEKLAAPPIMIPNENYETQLVAQAEQIAELQSAYEALKEESERGYETRYTEELQKVIIKHKLELMDAQSSQEKVITKLEREAQYWREKLEEYEAGKIKKQQQVLKEIKHQEMDEASKLENIVASALPKGSIKSVPGIDGVKVGSLVLLPESNRFLMAHEDRDGNQCGDYSLDSLSNPASKDFNLINDDLPGRVLDMTRINPKDPKSDILLALQHPKTPDEAALLYVLDPLDGKLKNLNHMASSTYNTQKRKSRKINTSSASGRVFAVKHPWTYFVGPQGASVKRVGYQECQWKCSDLAPTKGQGTLQDIRISQDHLYWLSTNKFGRLSLSLMGPVQDPLSPVSFESEAKGGIATSFEVAEGLVAVAVSFDQLDPSGTPETRLGIYQEKAGQQPWVWEDVSDTDHVRWIRITKLNNGMKLLLLFFNSDKPTIKPVLFDGVKMLVGERVFFPEGGKPVGVVKLNQDAAVSSWILAHAKAYIHINVRL